ncbi:MAG TPA: hypothetical protein PLO89_11880, partial [Spirochaetota bacterium]|nr:hypothetical protein [Spirochaetota bacterium]
FKCYELLSKYNFGRDVTVFIEFLKNYLEYKSKKNDRVYFNRMNDYFKDLVTKFPENNQAKWLQKEMAILKKAD